MLLPIIRKRWHTGAPSLHCLYAPAHVCSSTFLDSGLNSHPCLPLARHACWHRPLDRRYSRDELRPSLDQQPSSNLSSWRSDEMGAALGTSPPAPTSVAFAQYGAQANAPGHNAPVSEIGSPGGMARRASDGAAPGLEVSKERAGKASEEGAEAAAGGVDDGNVAVNIGRVIPTVPEERLSIQEALEARAKRFGLQVSSDEAAASEPVRNEGAAEAAGTGDGDVVVTIGRVIPTVPRRLSVENTLKARAKKFGMQVSMYEPLCSLCTLSSCWCQMRFDCVVGAMLCKHRSVCWIRMQC